MRRVLSDPLSGVAVTSGLPALSRVEAETHPFRMKAGNAEPKRAAPVLGAPEPVHRSTRTVVRIVGAVAGFAGVGQGLGALLHADLGSLLIPGWPRMAAFEPLSGEPPMTLIPDPRIAAAVTMLVSLTLAWWALRVQASAVDAWVLLALSALLLLVGGGVGPPLVGLVIGVALLAAVSRDPRAAPPGPTRQALGPAWRPLLALTVCAFLALFPGVVLLRWIAGIDVVWIPVVLTILAFTWLMLTLVAARADDARR